MGKITEYVELLRNRVAEQDREIEEQRQLLAMYKDFVKELREDNLRTMGNVKKVLNGKYNKLECSK